MGSCVSGNESRTMKWKYNIMDTRWTEISCLFHCEDIGVSSLMQSFTKLFGYNPWICPHVTTSLLPSKSKFPSPLLHKPLHQVPLECTCLYYASAAPKNSCFSRSSHLECLGWLQELLVILLHAQTWQCRGVNTPMGDPGPKGSELNNSEVYSHLAV